MAKWLALTIMILLRWRSTHNLRTNETDYIIKEMDDFNDHAKNYNSKARVYNPPTRQ